MEPAAGQGARVSKPEQAKKWREFNWCPVADLDGLGNTAAAIRPTWPRSAIVLASFSTRR
jgi:hypothetical protein